MSIAKKPLQPHDFPVNAEGKKIKRQDGTPDRKHGQSGHRCRRC